MAEKRGKRPPKRKGTSDVSVQELHDLTRWLLDHGYGELPVYVLYETVFGHADYLDVVTQQGGRGCPGLFIGEA